MKRVHFLTSCPEETRRLGEILGRHLKKGDVVALRGDLGAGKTCFVQGIARGLGVPEEEYVRSPSFVIINEYRGSIPLYHLDFYRLSEEEIKDLHIDEYLHQGVAVVEWADRAPGLLPEEALLVEFHILEGDRRRIEMGGSGRWEDVLSSMEGEALTRSI